MNQKERIVLKNRFTTAYYLAKNEFVDYPELLDLKN